MKRSMRSAKPKTAPVPCLAPAELAQVKGGATAIEYGLVVQQPPPK